MQQNEPPFVDLLLKLAAAGGNSVGRMSMGTTPISSENPPSGILFRGERWHICSSRSQTMDGDLKILQTAMRKRRFAGIATDVRCMQMNGM